MELTLRNIMLNPYKNIFFFGHHVKNDYVFLQTHTFINKDLYTVISYDIHNMHAKFKEIAK